jgi:opacity protein-like surface antigen
MDVVDVGRSRDAVYWAFVVDREPRRRCDRHYRRLERAVLEILYRRDGERDFQNGARKTDGIGLFTGQIGYAWNASLFYFKGGAAVTSNRFSVLDNLTGVELAAASATRWGGTVGVGWEYGFAPNWSAGIEYDHLFMGHANNSFTATDPRLVGFLNDRISQDVDMLTLRINYRFGGYGAPIAARY